MASSKDKNEPGRFLGEGVAFRAKLIGVLEVPEARGDRMCQEALADLKMAIRAAGEHKQRIQVHVAIDGLRLRDDKTGDSLYHHPVHKISFIAQDMTDSRAFGYIFGSPDTGHRFFGIKTDKAASQVVIAMRDLFQVVFELKKKEVELAKQQLEGKVGGSGLVRHAGAAIAGADPKDKGQWASHGLKPSVGLGLGLGVGVDESRVGGQPKAEAEGGMAEGGVAELVDLEQELSSLRRGLTQVEGLTPAGPGDPFGDSFLPPSGHTAKGLLPPPPSGSSTRGRNTPSSRVFSPNKSSLPFDLAAVAADFEPHHHQPQPQPASLVDHTHTLTDNSELKNPPKKVLKDLVPSTSTTTHTQSLLSDILPDSAHSRTEQYGPTGTTGGTTTMTTMTSLSRHSGGTVSIAKPPAYAAAAAAAAGGHFYSADPFAETDPFDNTDPFSDSFKDDPFTTMAEFPKSMLRAEDFKSKLSREMSLDKDSLSLSDSGSGIVAKSVFNGPLQVSLPPEPVPKSPRLQRQNTESSSIRQRPQPSSKVSSENASPPPPLPPKKISEVTLPRPPPRPPHEHEDDGDVGPPLPRPARKKEPMADRSTKPRLSSITTNSSEEEAYLTPAPPPVPSPKRFDITLSQLLVCTMPELAARLRVPEATLSSMTLPQLTEYLRSYLAADNDKKHIHVDPVKKPEDFPKQYTATAPPIPSIPHLEKLRITPPVSDFRPQFEDNFTPPPHSADTFVANFEDFDKKANPSYDRYAAFREIQEQELKSKSILDPMDSPTKEELRQDSEETEVATINNLIINNNKEKEENKEISKSPLKSLDELTLDSFNMFRNSVSPKPAQPIDAKIEDIKSVMKTLQIEKNVGRRSVSPREPRENNIEDKDNANDRYAALREITITEPPQDEFESLPPEAPKERKRSDEKSDGFDNSDFFDCIDNSSLSFSHVEDAFRKSPSVKEKEEVKVVEEKKETAIEPLREVREALPTRMSTGSVSDVASGSSPDTKDKRLAPGSSGGRGARTAGAGTGTRAGRWAVLGSGAGASPWSSDSRDSEPRPRRRRPHPHTHHEPAHGHTRGGIVQTSSSSRDVSPWDEEPPPPPVARLQRPPPPAHAHRDRDRDRDRDSRHGSSGSRECLDSGSGREKDKRDKRDSRDREIRDGRDSGRERRDSGSGRDRRDSKERDHREHRDRRDRRSRDRERENESWDRDRSYSREREYRGSRSRERKDYRDRHRKPRHCYGDDEDYSDGCESGRSSPRERWPDQRWRRDERNYGSLGWRESRRRVELRPSEDSNDRRYGTTLNWPSRRSGSRRDSDRDRDRDSRDRSDRSELRDRSDRSELRDRSDRSELRDRTDRDTRDRTDRDTRDRDPRRRSRREEREPRRPRVDYRFSNDFTARSPRSPPSLPHVAHPQHAPHASHTPHTPHASPFDNEFADTPTVNNKKRAPYTSLEGTRFTFDPEEATASPLSVSSARRDGDSASVASVASAASGAGGGGGGGGSSATRFRFDSDSVSPRSMFEDDFTTISTPRGRTASIAEEEESVVPPLRKPPNSQLNQHRDIKKSESVNIFTRESDPFEGDAFFACTGSDRAARRDNWPGDFQGFDNA